jgi:C-terminal processing protease CtpA/Prc
VTAKGNKNICQISKEQKLYELSVIWKELSYNFANMDNCPLINLDSLYQAYIPLIQNTKNDFEYCKRMLRFVSHFNNGHTNVRDIPMYLDPYIARFYLETTYKDDKIIVENIGKEYANEIQIGDEITHINGINALKYFEKKIVPYITASNEKAKIYQAMFNKSGLAHLFKKDAKLTLTVQSQKNIKKVDVYANHEFPPNNSTKANWLIDKDKKSNKRQVIIDTVNSFMYVHFLFCDENFYSFFKESNNEINKYKNLIIDLSDNQGGNLYYDYSLHFLFEKDTLLDLISATKVNRAACKARGKAVCDSPDFQQKITPYCHSCCDYYKGTFFERMTMNNVPNFALESQRYKGNIYMITNRNTASAAEGFAIAFSQNTNVSIIGKKTAGTIGQPYMISLPSGLVVCINTDKTYDYKGNEVSAGFPPDYEYDFSEIYKIRDPQEMLSNFIKVIKELEKK